MYRFLILFFILFYNSVSAQIILNRDTSLKIYENGERFNSPFIGGINSAQISEIDLNLDGILDLVVFDKSGNKIIPFINNNNHYIYEPKYRDNFPETHDWMLLADYNCDGKNDIYTYSSGGMAIYENTSTNELNFTLISPLVMSDYGNNNLNIYISPVDIPAITDVDDDGDLDILTFSILGGFVEYHKNTAIELSGSCDTIAFELSENCWGLFYEGLNNYVLNCPNCQCPSIINNINQKKQKHAGSTLCAIDIDNDNDQDLILGDVSFNNVNLLINGGDNQNAFMVNVDSIFPQNYNNTTGANIQYPASYYIDVTNDGIKDLLVTTNSENNSENFESIWLYTNNGQNNNPNFTFEKTNFLQDEMIDLGTSAFPSFYDYNGDSLLDIVVGNYGYHNVNGNPTSSLALFKNIGTSNNPKYDLIDRDWLGISSINLNTTLNMPSLNIYPSFGDLNGDGNDDLLIGDANGKLHFFTNTGVGSFQLTSADYFNIDVGYFAQPQIIDVNRDGLNDIIIGEQNGTINYCPNNGTNNIALFDTVITNLGGINVDDSLISTGFSSPFMIDINGSYQLFVGSYSGNIYQFNNIDNNLTGTFNNINSAISEIWDGGKCALTLADITNDNKLDMILGNVSGGISYFSSDSALINDFNQEQSKNDILLFPNPASQQVTIINSELNKIKIIDLYGRTLYSQESQDISTLINIEFLTKGIYIVQSGNRTSKLIIK